MIPSTDLKHILLSLNKHEFLSISHNLRKSFDKIWITFKVCYESMLYFHEKIFNNYFYYFHKNLLSSRLTFLYELIWWKWNRNIIFYNPNFFVFSWWELSLFLILIGHMPTMNLIIYGSNNLLANFFFLSKNFINIAYIPSQFLHWPN